MLQQKQANFLTETSPAGGPTTVAKPVFALAIEPLSMPLTVTGRKAYTVMMSIATRTGRNEEGWYSAPVSEILTLYGSDTKCSERLQRYIEDMAKTTVRWRPLTASDQPSLFLPEDDSSQQITKERRVFSLLAEARTFIRRGQAWVNWVYPPTIEENLHEPDRYARIELTSIARLTTYTSVALYEMCARFKNSPGELTARQPTDFWIASLRESGEGKPREWRKIKSELVNKAIDEINQVTEITIEMIEHRRGRSVSDVQFRVKVKLKPREVTNEPIDTRVLESANLLGIRESDYDQLVEKYDSQKVDTCIATMSAILKDKPGSIHRTLAYLRAMLTDRHPEAQISILQTDANEPNSVGDGAPKNDWLTARYDQLLVEFDALTDEQRQHWIRETLKTITTNDRLAKATRMRLNLGEWRTPMVRRATLDVYANGRYGAGWNIPPALKVIDEGEIIVFTQ